jgi:hypothetical protein
MRLLEAVVDAKTFAKAFATRVTKYRDLSDKAIAWLIANIKGEGIGMGFKDVKNRQDFIMKSNVPKTDDITSQQEEVVAYANDVYKYIQQFVASAGPMYRTQITRKKIVNGFLLAYNLEPLQESELNTMKQQIREIFDPENLDDNTFEDELEQYNSSDIDDSQSFDELFTDIDDDDHNFEEIFNKNDLQSYDAAEAFPDTDDWEEEYELYHESFKSIFNKSKLQEGGPRKNMSQDTINRFVHELLLVPDATRRQEIVDEIFEKIAEENMKSFQKSQKKLDQTEEEVKEEIK